MYVCGCAVDIRNLYITLGIAQRTCIKVFKYKLIIFLSKEGKGKDLHVRSGNYQIR